MLSPDPEEKLKAARAAIQHFNIRGSGYTIFYEPTIDDYGTMNPFGSLQLGPRAFYLWSDLAITLGHEIEIHWEKQFKVYGAMDPIHEGQDRYMREVEAERYEIENASRFGRSQKQTNESRKVLDGWYNLLKDRNKSLVNKGIYNPL